MRSKRSKPLNRTMSACTSSNARHKSSPRPAATAASMRHVRTAVEIFAGATTTTPSFIGSNGRASKAESPGMASPRDRACWDESRKGSKSMS